LLKSVNKPTEGKDMKRNSKLIGASLAIAVAVAFVEYAEAQTNIPKPTYKYEKCFGIARGGQNDCFSPANSCGKTSKRDNDPNAWIRACRYMRQNCQWKHRANHRSESAAEKLGVIVLAKIEERLQEERLQNDICAKSANNAAASRAGCPAWPSMRFRKRGGDG
jgi:uncharacterized membrane protein